MKKLLYVLLVGFAGTRVEAACIDLHTANTESQIRSSGGEYPLPPLPEGWEWIKVYKIDENNPYDWYWQSWPKEVCPS